MPRTSRRSRVALAVPIAFALAAFTGCSDTGNNTGAQGTKASSGQKDTLTLGMTADISGWSPLIQPSYQGWIADALWESLLYCDEHGKPQPGAAETFEFSDDLTTATLKLRSGQKFSDGTALDSADVKATIPAVAEKNARFAKLTVDTPDALTVSIKWPAPNPTIALKVCELRVAPSELIASGNLDQKPVGSGPYTLDEAATTQGSVYTLTKKEDHWNSKAFPYKKLVLKVLKDETASLNALKTGQINGTLLSAATVDEAKRSKQEVVSLQGVTTRLLITDHKGEKIPALGSVQVRQAMNMVFDRKAIAEKLYRGYADPAYQIFRPGSAAFIEGLEDPYPFDVDKAKALMAEAGFADGFTLEIPHLDGQNHDLLIPFVTDQLAELNIKVKQVNLSGPDAITNLLSGKYPVPLWQLGNYGESLQDIQDYLLPDGIWNVSHQTDATVDKLWQSVLTGSDDERAKAQKDLNQFAIDQAWFVPMAYPEFFYAHSPTVEIPHVSDFAALHPHLRDFK